MTEPEFNLISEPWIKVLDKSGLTKEISLLQLFAQAQNYRQFANELATLDVAIMRLILAIMHGALGDEAKDESSALDLWKRLWTAGEFPIAAIKKYLDYYRDEFWLFHPERPFYQVAYLTNEKIVKATFSKCDKLIGDLSISEHKPRLFAGRFGIEALEFAEAARWLLFYQGFGTAFAGNVAKKVVFGTDKYNLESNGAAWLGKLGLIYNQGRNLFETLMLNFVLLNDNGEVWDKNDLAVWEDKTYRQPEFYFNQSFFAKSQKKLLTMQSRSILLKKEGKLVTGYYAIKGGKGFITDNNEFSTANVFVEQMTLWKLVNDNFIAKRHIPSKQLWRDAASLIQSTKLNYPPGVIKWRSYLGNLLDKVPATLKIASIKYGDKDGIIIDAFADELQINQQVFAHLDQFADRIPGTVAITDQAVSVFATLAGELVLASGADKGEKGSNLIVIRNKAREKAYFALDLPFRQWLVGVNEVDNYDEKEIAWKKQLKLILFHLADDLIQATPESAYVGCKKDGRWYTLAAADSKFRNILCSAKVLNLVVKTKDDDVK